MRLERTAARQRRTSLTPIIDVVFLLLMFFMLASTFSRYAHVDLGLAGSVEAAAEPSERRAILLSVRGAGGFAVNGQAVVAAEIAAALKRAAAGAQAQILIRPAEEARAEDLVRAVEQTRAAGVGPAVLVR